MDAATQNWVFEWPLYSLTLRLSSGDHSRIRPSRVLAKTYLPLGVNLVTELWKGGRGQGRRNELGAERTMRRDKQSGKGGRHSACEGTETYTQGIPWALE